MDVNVMSYGAQTLVHVAGGNQASISTDTLYQTGAFTAVSPGDTLWLQTGEGMGIYTITDVDPSGDSVTVAYESWPAAANARWKITEGAVYDCTADFQEAIDAASVEGGKVNVPPGYYYLAGALNVTRNAVLTGMWNFPMQWSEALWMDGTVQGPVLCPTHDMGDDEGTPFITLNGNGRNAGVEGLSIYYPLQGVVEGLGTDTVSVMEYPPCISMGGFSATGGGLDHRARNLQLVNPYYGIRMGAGGRNHIHGVFGCALRHGILADRVTDVCVIENCHFHPDFFVQSGTDDFAKDIKTFLVKNLTAFEVNRADYMVLRGISAWLLNRGLLLKDSEALTFPPHSLTAEIIGTDILFDACNVGIEVLSGNATLTNVKLSTVFPDGHVNDPAVFDVLQCIRGVSATGFDTNLSINGGTMATTGSSAIHWDIDDAGWGNTGGWLNVGNILFIDGPAAQDYGIHVLSGRALIYNNKFSNSGTYGFTEAIRIESGVKKAVVYGNDYLGNSPGSNAAADRVMDVQGMLQVASGPGNDGIVVAATGSGYSPFLTFKDNGNTAADKYGMRYDGANGIFFMGRGDSSGFTEQVSIHQSSGNLGVGTTSPGEKLDVNGNVHVSGNVKIASGYSLIVSDSPVPSSSSDTMGVVGQIAWDNDYLYIRTNDPTYKWKRVTLAFPF